MTVHVNFDVSVFFIIILIVAGICGVIRAIYSAAKNHTTALDSDIGFTPHETLKESSENNKHGISTAIIVITVVLVVVFVVYLGLGVSSNTSTPSKTSQTSQTSQSHSTKQPVESTTPSYSYELTMLDYYNELKNNSVATNAKYDGKRVKITGKIYSIEDTQRYYTVGGPFVTSVDVYAIQLTDGTHMVYSSLLTCYFDKTNTNKKQLAALSSGEEVTLIGKFTTSEWPSGVVVMEECVVVSK